MLRSAGGPAGKIDPQLLAIYHGTWIAVEIHHLLSLIPLTATAFCQDQSTSDKYASVNAFLIDKLLAK